MTHLITIGEIISGCKPIFSYFIFAAGRTIPKAQQTVFFTSQRTRKYTAFSYIVQYSQ